MEQNRFDIKRKKAIYKAYAPTYDEDRRISVGDDILNERMYYIVFHVQEGSKVLDLGCGTGDLLRVLSQKVGHDGRCIGIDISPDMLNIAKKKLSNYTNVELQTGNVTKKLRFDSDYFDVVTALNINQEIPLKQQKDMFKEASRILKKDGVFIGYSACLSGTTEAETGYTNVAKDYLWYFYPYLEIVGIFQDVFRNAVTAFKSNLKASSSESKGTIQFKLLIEIMTRVKEKGYNPDDVIQGVLQMRGIS